LIGGGGGGCRVGNRDRRSGLAMRTSPPARAAPAAAAYWLMGITSVLSSVAAGRHVSPVQSTASSTADQHWPTAIAGQFVLLRYLIS